MSSAGHKDATMMSHEQLSEALVALERARRREAEQRLETEALLEGLRALTEARDTRDVFENMAAVLARFVPFDDAFLLAADEDGGLRAIHSTNPLYQDSRWALGPTLARVVAGEIVSLFAVADTPEWMAQPEPIRARARSALHTRLRSGRSCAVLILASANPAAFSKRHVQLLARLAPLTDQTLADIAQREALEARTRELQTANQHLEAARLQLLQNEKLASIGQLAAGVAHEINNPVGFVLANLRTLDRYMSGLLDVLSAYQAMALDVAPTHPSQKRLQRALDASDLDYVIQDAPALVRESCEGCVRVRDIVRDLKDFSRAGSVEAWQRANVETELERTLHVIWPQLKDHVKVIREFAGIAPIECLPSRLNQVFLNLLLNAGQALSEPGTIWLRTGSSGDTVWVEIADDGPGIAPEHLGQIFDPFFTTKAVGQGTGLGLALSYGIVRDHGGRIEVESSPGRGARFRVHLPVRQLPTAPPDRVLAQQVETRANVTGTLQ